MHYSQIAEHQESEARRAWQAWIADIKTNDPETYRKLKRAKQLNFQGGSFVARDPDGKDALDHVSEPERYCSVCGQSMEHGATCQTCNA